MIRLSMVVPWADAAMLVAAPVPQLEGGRREGDVGVKAGTTWLGKLLKLPQHFGGQRVHGGRERENEGN
jgi:hypothetical protein